MEGGSSFGYRLLFVILLSNMIAIFLQNLTIRLGTITGLDLASASRKFFPRWLNIMLYVLAEIAIIATDVAEVIGSAIALNLLFPNLPLPAGVAITAVDVFIILLFYKEETDEEDGSTSGKMVRAFEMFVMILVAAVGVCFIVELGYSDVVAIDLLKGYLPNKEIFTEPHALYVAIGIVGATVMPHNLYLHSFIVQGRCREWKILRPHVEKKGDHWIVESDQFDLNPKPVESEIYHTALNVTPSTDQVSFDSVKEYLQKSLEKNLHYGFVDLLVALTFAFFVNCAILIVASANFYYAPESQQQQVQDLFGAHDLLLKYLGHSAATVFALALLCAGQSSTLTATLAGQVIMSGFLGMTTRPWIRRVVTRFIAIAPAMVAACVAGRSGLSSMLVASQVALSIQLPFAVVPLVYLTSTKSAMQLDLVTKDKRVKSTTFVTEQPKMSLLDRLLVRLRLSKSGSSWTRFSQMKESENLLPSIEEECELSCHSLEDKQLDSITIDTLPDPLVYANGQITTISAVLISILLIILNGYLVVSLFLQS
ncbi:hypothetical protein CU098_009574 [Rhizopus stolonifer]|uniref:Uncharacterized protein n=1 Tax=Rhizopus stolonifer TaxID=4846 RepID=A0A367JVM3_RHIST|nr:hypothetical protein CU098_009574 [Rhizopus stolonifer]